MTALLIIIIVLGLIGVVQFNRRAIDQEVIAQLRRDNRDKRDLREAFRESLRENERLTRTIKMLLGANMFVSQLQDDTHHNNEALRKELAELKPQLTRAEAAVVNFKSLYDGVGSVDEEWHNTFGVSSPEEEKRLIASMSAYLAKEIDDEIQRVYLHNPYSGRFRCGLN